MNTASTTRAKKADSASGTTTAVMLEPTKSSKDKLVKQIVVTEDGPEGPVNRVVII